MSSITEKVYNTYLELLEKELVPAMGCTEPASIAYGAATAKKILGTVPNRIEIEASGNIIKNTKSVVVPNTKGMVGIEAAIAAGIIGGNPDMGLEALLGLRESDYLLIEKYINTHKISISQGKSEFVFDFSITMHSDKDTVRLRICNRHTDIVHIEKNGTTLFQLDEPINNPVNSTDDAKYDVLNVNDIVNFTNIVHIEDVYKFIVKQMQLNGDVAKEGLRGDFGANIGKILLLYNDDVHTRARAMAAAASDARMGGCELPVIILSGSGNQGITASLPIVEYAKALGSSEDRLIRAIVLSDLLTLHQKRFIGQLSAYCGVVCAGAASGAGIAYLHGAGHEGIAHTLTNSLAISSGIICDGAKPSCAGKIALAVESGIMGFSMYRNGQRFLAGEGIVDGDVENTIRNVGIIGSQGMKDTDLILIRMMIESEKGDTRRA
jgi:L-cysteine desulfidase